MAFSAVKSRAVGAVRAYFLRDDLDERPFVGVVDIPPVAVSVMRVVFVLLSVFFASSAVTFYSEGSLIVPMLLGSSMSFMLIYLVAPQTLDKRILLLQAIAYLGPWAIILLRIDTGSLRDGLWIVSVGLCCWSAAMKWENGFLHFYLGYLFLCTTIMMVSAILISFDKFNMYNGLTWFFSYTLLCSEVMVRRIVKGDTDYVNHVVFLFTDLPYVHFFYGRIALRNWRQWVPMMKARNETVKEMGYTFSAV